MVVKRTRKIERDAYPRCFRAMQDCVTMDDVVEYCEAQGQDDLVVMSGKTWYFLAVRSTGEIVDLAGKMTLTDMLAVKRKICEEFAGRVVTLDARESTSYRVVGKLGRVIKDSAYEWGGETFHEMVIAIL